MQVVIFLIELHDDLLHTGCFAFILHNFSYFIQSDRRILCVGHKVNWGCSKVRCLSDRCCNCFFSAPHNCKEHIEKTCCSHDRSHTAPVHKATDRPSRRWTWPHNGSCRKPIDAKCSALGSAGKSCQEFSFPPQPPCCHLPRQLPAGLRSQHGLDDTIQGLGTGAFATFEVLDLAHDPWIDRHRNRMNGISHHGIPSDLVISYIIYIYTYILVNYNDLTSLPHWKSWFRYRGIIPKWPNYSG